MALRTILQEGDPSLSKPSRAITAFDDRLCTLLDDMQETLAFANGIGLAASQVGVLRRAALVLDINDEADPPTERLIELINPEIIKQEGEQTSYEGCLSVPAVMGAVTRPMHVKVRAQDRNGTWFEIESEGLTARALCHELDHLDGLLYTRLCDKLYDINNLPELDE